MNLELKYIDSIFIPVLNLKKSLYWYEKYFGAKINWQDRNEWNAASIGF